jgi:chloramphenicol 3-O-phosphotransferase
VAWIAYLDESMRQRRDGSGLYVLAAAVLDEMDAPRVRAAVAQLAEEVGAGKRVHWRDESPVRRRRLVEAMARLDAVHLVVVGLHLDNRRQERGRRHCLRRMLWELGEAGVGQAWLEARTPSLNRADTDAVMAMRARREIRPDLRVGFTYPSEEPLVWLPDVTAGAVSAARGDGDDQYLVPLSSLLTEHTIELD